MIRAKYDREYETWRNTLIPQAIAMADAYRPCPPNANRVEVQAWSLEWDAAYHRAMAELTSDVFRARGAN